MKQLNWLHSELEDQQVALLYSGAKNIPSFSQRPFHFRVYGSKSNTQAVVLAKTLKIWVLNFSSSNYYQRISLKYQKNNKFSKVDGRMKNDIIFTTICY